GLSTTDTLLVRSDTPVVVSHVAAFQRALSSTEVGSVGAQVVQWPYGQVINTAPEITGGGTVDLTPVLNNQSTYMPQIVDIQNKLTAQIPIISNIQTVVTYLQGQWNNYASVTLPSLNDLLNNIYSGIQSTITTGAGALSRTLGQMLSGVDGD